MQTRRHVLQCGLGAGMAATLGLRPQHARGAGADQLADLRAGGAGRRLGPDRAARSSMRCAPTASSRISSSSTRPAPAAPSACRSSSATKKGQGDALMVGGMVMVGALIANKSPVSMRDLTPIARLTGEFGWSWSTPASPHKIDAGPGGRLQGGPGQGIVGRRLGRRHRPHPGRHDRQGPGRRGQGA